MNQPARETRRTRFAALAFLDDRKAEPMASVGDTKSCPECGKTATLCAIINPLQRISRRDGLIPPPATRRVLVWQCEDPLCDYSEVLSA